MPVRDARNGKGSANWYLGQVGLISQDQELMQKEKLSGTILTRMEYIFTLLILRPFVGPFEWIWDDLQPSIGKVATIALGIGVFLVFTIPCMALSLVLMGLYCLGEGLMFPFVALFAVIKDAIDAKQDYIIQPLSRNEVKVKYRFKHHLFRLPYDQIEYYVTTLDLSSNRLHEKSLSEILNLLKSIPSHIRHLNLANNGLGTQISKASLVQIYEALPRDLLSLDLSENRFPNISLFSALPKTLNTLKLNSCNLTYQQFSPLLTTLPEALTSLELARNPDLLDFNNHQITSLSTPTKKLKLILSDNVIIQSNTPFSFAITTRPAGINISLVPFSPPQRTQFFSLLPNQITALDFRKSNFFDNLSSEDLILPEQLTELGLNLSVLRAGQLKLNHAAKLETIRLSLASMPDDRGLYDLPESVNKLDLSHNQLGRFKRNDLAMLLTRIPQQVKTLDLSHNQLGNLEESDLLHFFSSIPGHIRTVNLDYNGLFHRCENIADADRLFKRIQEVLPSTLHLNRGNGYSLTSQFGLLLTPRSIAQPKGPLHQLPHEARNLIYKFLRGGDELVNVQPFLEPILETNPVPKPASLR
jgi:hypothetical protein